MTSGQESDQAKERNSEPILERRGYKYPSRSSLRAVLWLVKKWNQIFGKAIFLRQLPMDWISPVEWNDTWLPTSQTHSISLGAEHNLCSVSTGVKHNYIQFRYVQFSGYLGKLFWVTKLFLLALFLMFSYSMEQHRENRYIKYKRYEFLLFIPKTHWYLMMWYEVHV